MRTIFHIPCPKEMYANMRTNSAQSKPQNDVVDHPPPSGGAAAAPSAAKPRTNWKRKYQDAADELRIERHMHETLRRTQRRAQTTEHDKSDFSRLKTLFSMLMPYIKDEGKEIRDKILDELDSKLHTIDLTD